MNGRKIASFANHRSLLILMGCVLLVWACYQLSGQVLRGGSLRFMAFLLAVPLLYLLYQKPILLIAAIVLIFNSILERKFFPIQVGGRVQVLLAEVLLVVGYLSMFRDFRGRLYDLFLGSPVRKALLVLLLYYVVCLVWSNQFLKLGFFGEWGLFHWIRSFAFHLFLFVILAQIRWEEDLMLLFKIFLAASVLSSTLHIIVFFQKGEGILGQIFPAFLWNPLPLVTGTYYGTDTGYLRLNLPAGALVRTLVVMCLSFYLHTRKRYWLYFVLFFSVSVLLQFTRMAWVSTLAVLPLFFVIMERDRLMSRIREGAARFSWTKFLFGVLVFVSVFYLLGNVMRIPAVRFIMERFLSITKGSQESSYTHRMEIFVHIWEQVSRSPLHLLLGNGIIFMTADSGYFALLGGMGLIGLATYMVLFVLFFVRGLRIYYLLEKIALKAFCLGATLSYLRVMINGVTGGYVTSTNWIVLVCLLLAIPELCLRFDRSSESLWTTLPDKKER